MRRKLIWLAILAVAGAASWLLLAENPNPMRTLGAPMDSLDGVVVHYNGRTSRTEGRHRSAEGYNYGLRWQCVEFVKRYYHDALHHSFPDGYGHARDFFDPAVKDGGMNTRRGLVQCSNGGRERPAKGDLMVWAPSTFNPYGHVAIVSEVKGDEVQVIQQNSGPWGSSRKWMEMKAVEGRVNLPKGVLGWLRLPRAQ